MNEKPKESLSGSRDTVCELLTNADEKVLEEIKALEEKIFDWEVEEDDLKALVEKIQDPSSMTLVLRDQVEAIVGYLITIPSDRVDEEVQAADTAFEADSSKAYVETLAIDSNHRGNISQIKGLFEQLASTATSNGFEVIAAHIPTHHLPLYERFSDVEVLRTIENWFDSGEDHHYIEIKL